MKKAWIDKPTKWNEGYQKGYEQGKRDGEIKTREGFISDAERWKAKSGSKVIPIDWLIDRLKDDLRIRKKELKKEAKGE